MTGRSERQLRVLQFIPSLWFGGLERVATELTLGLAARGDRVLVASSGGEPFGKRLRDAGIQVSTVPRPRPQPKRLVSSARALARVLGAERQDVVHAHNPAAGAAAAIARRLAGQRELAIVTTYHGVEPGSFGRAQRALALSSDVVVGCGPGVTRELQAAGIRASHSATVFNALELTRARGEDAIRDEFGAGDAELVVTVGRYEPEKNQALLIEALALLAPARPRLRALIVGIGGLENELRQLVRARGLEGVVTLTGQRGDAHDLMAAADVVTLSSVREALPLVVIEAMALGRPVVSTDVGGVSDLVRHERTGLLVPSHDAAALGGAIARVLDDRTLAADLGSAAQALAGRLCSAETMVDRYRLLYEDAIAGRRR